MYSLYLHIPFCRHRCAYCDFNTYAGLSPLIPAYVQALCCEIAFYRLIPPLPVHTVYFGGGTPSLLPLEAFAQIFSSLRSAFDLQPSAEVSLEANPGTLHLDYLCGLRQLGFNRISLGMQSARPNELRLLERRHQAEDVAQAVVWARQAGFANLSLDLIFGLPSQALTDWQYSLESALAMQPQHLSLYALTVEEGTPFGAWVQGGLLPEPDADLAADMYDFASDRLAAAGFMQYEISNWARDGEAPGGRPGAVGCASPREACAHNLQYWRNRPYLGLGAGAHGYLASGAAGAGSGGLRVANVSLPQDYISCLRAGEASSPAAMLHPSPAVATATPIDRAAEMSETMIMGLRLTAEGVSEALFRQRFGQGLLACYGDAISRLIGQGLLEWAGDAHEILRLTRRGRLLGNQVFMAFLA
ncbi:MAG: radical SAM family heme chaperone HemW [Chloroflexota bacterium]